MTRTGHNKRHADVEEMGRWYPSNALRAERPTSGVTSTSQETLQRSQSGTEAAGVVAPATSSCSVPVRIGLTVGPVPADQPARDTSYGGHPPVC